MNKLLLLNRDEVTVLVIYDEVSTFFFLLAIVWDQVTIPI